MYMGFQTGTRCETSLSDSCKNAPMSKKCERISSSAQHWLLVGQRRLACVQSVP